MRRLRRSSSCTSYYQAAIDETKSPQREAAETAEQSQTWINSRTTMELSAMAAKTSCSIKPKYLNNNAYKAASVFDILPLIVSNPNKE